MFDRFFLSLSLIEGAYQKSIVFEKGLFPIQIGDLCTVIKQKATLVNVDPDTIITCFSHGNAYPPLQEGFLFIGSYPDAFVIEKMSLGGAAFLTDRAIPGIPCIVVEDVVLAEYRICSWLYEAIDLPAIAVSGSTGKTTTKRLISDVLGSEKSVFSIRENRNTLDDLCCFFQNVTTRNELGVWEISENRPRETKICSRILKPEILVITNVGDSHIGSIEGGKEGLIRSFQGLTEGMGENGIVIINADDADSNRVNFGKPMISVGIQNTNADCIAENISNTKTGTEFDLNYRGDTTHIYLSVFGLHNVYNAMMAYVVGVLNGISKPAILRAMRNYRNEGIRQNIIRKRGVVVYADCYNASAISVSYAIQCFCELSDLHGKRVAVLGDIGEIEGYEEEAYRRIAEAVDNSTIDILLTYGVDSRMIQNYVKRDIESHHFTSEKDLNNCLKQLNAGGKNAYLLKGSRKMHMESTLKAVFPLHYYSVRFVEKVKERFPR